MALAYESVQTSNSGTTSVTVTKPVSLAVGDLMVAHLACSKATSATLGDFTATGWTLIATDVSESGNSTHRASAFYKVADSSDTAATDFTFTADADSESICGAIYRFSGGSVPSGAADDDPTSTQTHTFTNTMTPIRADSILLFLVSGVANGATGFQTYAIATDNPTWTERYDINNTAAAGDGDTTMAGATGPRAAVTATGNATVENITMAINDSVCIIAAVYPTLSVSVSPTVISLVSSVQAPTVSASAVVSPTVITATASIQAPTVTTSLPKWVNPDKSNTSPTITNPDKTV